jgi:hypothetical protein
MTDVLRCHGGSCDHTVRCARHAAEHAKAVMEERGWVLLHEYGGAENLDPHFLGMVRAVQRAGTELQRWMAGWDAERGVPKVGIWAPRVAACILGLMADKLSEDDLTSALIAAKVDHDFAQAVDAAYRMGGNEAAAEVLRDRLPTLTFRSHPPRKR